MLENSSELSESLVRCLKQVINKDMTDEERENVFAFAIVCKKIENNGRDYRYVFAIFLKLVKDAAREKDAKDLIGKAHNKMVESLMTRPCPTADKDIVRLFREYYIFGSYA
jgi:hypothetical protein